MTTTQYSLCVRCLGLISARAGGMKWSWPWAGEDGLVRTVGTLFASKDGDQNWLLDNPEIVFTDMGGEVFGVHAVTYVLGTGYCVGHALAAGFLDSGWPLAEALRLRGGR